MSAPSTRGNVLLIEDDYTQRELLVTGLEQAGWTVRSAGDGLSGMAMLDVFRPDVIVLDMRMPAAGGVMVLDALTDRGVTAPVIAVSGYDYAIDYAREHARVLAMIRKPFTPDELIGAVERAKEWSQTKAFQRPTERT